MLIRIIIYWRKGNGMVRRQSGQRFYFIVALLTCFNLLSCTSAQYLFVRWNGNIIKESPPGPRFLYWADGIQIYRVLTGDIEIHVAGSADNKYAYFMTKIYNHSTSYVNIYPGLSRLIQKSKEKDITIAPVRPRILREKAKSSAALAGLVAALSVPAFPGLNATAAEKTYFEYKKESVQQSYARNLYAIKEYSSSLISAMLKDHTLGENQIYEGCLIFPINTTSILGSGLNDQFYLGLLIGDQKTVIQGKLRPGYHNDELDTPEDLKQIQFSN